MRQVKSGRLYIRYRSRFQKNGAKECKMLTDYIPLLFYIATFYIFYITTFYVATFYIFYIPLLL